MIRKKLSASGEDGNIGADRAEPVPVFGAYCPNPPVYPGIRGQSCFGAATVAVVSVKAALVPMNDIGSAVSFRFSAFGRAVFVPLSGAPSFRGSVKMQNGGVITRKNRGESKTCFMAVSFLFTKEKKSYFKYPSIYIISAFSIVLRRRKNVGNDRFEEINIVE